MISEEQPYTRKNSLRLNGFDYAWPRIYFVTINAHSRRRIFNDERVASATVKCLKELRLQFRFNVYVFCLMPDHFHALIGPGTSAKTLGAICGGFKSLSTRAYWQWHDGKLWHRQFYDHILRNREDFEETLNYIRMNPVRRRLVQRAEAWPYTERLDYLHLVAQANDRAGTSPAPTE
jgi:REP element-mobilizing transposase RayT